MTTYRCRRCGRSGSSEETGCPRLLRSPPRSSPAPTTAGVLTLPCVAETRAQTETVALYLRQILGDEFCDQAVGGRADLRGLDDGTVTWWEMTEVLVPRC